MQSVIVTGIGAIVIMILFGAFPNALNLISAPQAAILGWALGFIGNMYLQEQKEEKEKKSKIFSNRNIVIAQLEYSVKFLDERSTYENDAKIIYLQEWPQCIEAANFSEEDKKIIIKWIQHLVIISCGVEKAVQNNRFGQSIGTADLVAYRVDSELKNKIDVIIKKYKVCNT